MQRLEKPKDLKFYDSSFLTAYPQHKMENLNSKLYQLKQLIINTSRYINTLITEQFDVESSLRVAEYHIDESYYIQNPVCPEDRIKNIKYNERLKKINLLTQERKELSDAINEQRLKVMSMQSNFHDHLSNYWNDHREMIPDDFVPDQIQYKDDLIPSGAIALIGAQITGDYNTYWRYVGVGKSSTGASMENRKLFDEVQRFTVDSVGGFNSINDEIRSFFAIPSSIPEGDYYETGLFNRLFEGDMFYRVVQQKPIKHKKKNHMIFSNVIYITSR